MIEEREEELSEGESRALRSLRTERLPAPGLEDRVVAHLKERGLLRSGLGRRWLRAAAALAACLVLFLGGAVVGARLTSLPPEPTGNRFILFLYEGSDYRQSAPGAERERIAEYGAWARSLSALGNLVTGEKLKEGEQILGAMAPPAGGGEGQAGTRPASLGGYFVIAAKDAGQAREIASTCPHLRYGGWIVIREIDPV